MQNAHLKTTKRYLVVASTRHHHARLLKYYPRPPYALSFVKSRMLRPRQTHFLLFQQIFFILVCIHAGTPRVPPRVLTQKGKSEKSRARIFSSYFQKKLLRYRQSLGFTIPSPYFKTKGCLRGGWKILTLRRPLPADHPNTICFLIQFICKKNVAFNPSAMIFLAEK